MNKIHPVILNILNERGISSEQDIREFLSDKPQLTHDPFSLYHLEAGVDFVLSAIEQKKTICIYGDYDADGVTSVCLLMQILSKLTEKLFYYIPSRFEEGYGLNCEAIAAVRQKGADLIITVDCGSTSYDEVEYAKSLGMDIMVTDHHNMNEQVPDCLVINPKQAECQYPFSHLCGCGVAFKFAQALQRKARLPKSVLTEVLDLVAIATVGDIVPLVDENRSLVKYGLRVINSGRRKGLNALIKAVGLTPGKIKSENLAYVIVPHLNAAGRMLSAKVGVELLLAQDEGTIERAVEVLVANNKERRKVQEDTFLRCAEIVEKEMLQDHFLVIYGKDVHEGIAGIVAGKIKDMYHRPAIIVTDTTSKEEGMSLLKGTGRSLEGINLYEVLHLHEELFLRFGGHAGACGFTMAAEHLPLLREELNEEIWQLKQKDPQLFSEEIKTDASLRSQDITLNFIQQLECLAPYGCENEKPLFAVENVTVSKVFYMGQEQQHMRLQCACCEENQKNSTALSCVLFNGAKDYSNLTDGKRRTLIGCPELNRWNGKTQIQVLVEKILEMK